MLLHAYLHHVLLCFTGSHQDAEVKLSHINTEHLQLQYETSEETSRRYFSVHFTQDKKLLAATGRGGVEVRDADLKLTSSVVLPGKLCFDIKSSADSAYVLASASLDSYVVYRVDLTSGSTTELFEYWPYSDFMTISDNHIFGQTRKLCRLS